MMTLKRVAANALLAIITILAGLLGGREVWDRFVSTGPATPERVAGWERYSDRGHRLGAPAPTVTVVEFADFLCPFCQQAAQDLPRILAAYPNDVALVFRHYPLRRHQHAERAAAASECAAYLGAFWPFHKVLFAQANLIGAKPWTSFAREAGIRDVSEFEQCLSQANPAEFVADDVADANALGIRGTPLFLINGLRVPGYPGAETMKRYVEHELERAQGRYE